MSLEPQEQFRKFLENSKEVLILIPENPSADAVGSAWALYLFLEKRGLFPAIAFSNHLSPKLDFLPRPKKILSKISGARDFVLSFDTDRNKISQIRHEETSGRFNIYLTPEHGSVDPRDFSFILAKFKYDLIIVIDCADLEKLGSLYIENTDLFFEVPVVNIDHHSDNDNFGQINLVSVINSSCSEIVTETLEQINPDLVDKDIATCLLTGIIGATDSFQAKNTTPKSFLTASSLMDKGADQQEIIRWLYKTHPLPILKLWGRIMAKLNWDPESSLVWSEVTLEDFIQSRSNSDDLPSILEKIQENYSEGKIFALIHNETPSSSIVLVKTSFPERLKKLHLLFGGELKRELLEFKIDKGNLLEVGKEIAQKIKADL